MSQNQLLGKRISLISKKNIRYEGTLYSVNEQNATVALQNVRSFGTEGREVETGDALVLPSEAVHPFLLFRGQDIKDLHVHDEDAASPTAAAAAATTAPAPPTAATPAAGPAQSPPEVKQPPLPAASMPNKAALQQATPAVAVGAAAAAAADQTAASAADALPKPSDNTVKATTATVGDENYHSNHGSDRRPPSVGARSGGRGRGGRGGRRPRYNNPAAAPGTGASLLNRTARGMNGGRGSISAQQDPSPLPSDDFDFQSNLEQFKKEVGDDEDEAGDSPDAGTGAYEKNDFFDSISCDALDRESGIDNRLRGAAERNLNTETFGAVALNAQRRRGGRYGGNGGGRGRGSGTGGGTSGRGGRGRGGGYRGGGRSSGRAGSGRSYPSGSSSSFNHSGRGEHQQPTAASASN